MLKKGLGGGGVFLLHVCTRARRETCVLFPFLPGESFEEVEIWGKCGCILVRLLIRGIPEMAGCVYFEVCFEDWFCCILMEWVQRY